MVAAAWRKLGRYHALVAINTGTQTPEQLRHRHGSVLGRLLPLVERGQAEGAFRADVPAGWHLSMLMALVHAGSAELRAGRVPEDDAEAALVATVLGAVASPGPQGTDGRSRRAAGRPVESRSLHHHSRAGVGSARGRLAPDHLPAGPPVAGRPPEPCPADWATPRPETSKGDGMTIPTNEFPRDTTGLPAASATTVVELVRR